MAFVVPLRLRKLMNWCAPHDGFGNPQYDRFPAFPDGDDPNDELRAERVLRALADEDQLELVRLVMQREARNKETIQVERLIKMRWHAVNLLESCDRYDLLNRYDP